MNIDLKNRPKYKFILYFLCLIFAEIIIRNFFTRTFNLNQATFLDKYLKTIVAYVITAIFCYLLKYSAMEILTIMGALFLSLHSTLFLVAISVDSEYMTFKLTLIYLTGPLVIGLIWSLCRIYFVKNFHWKKLWKLFSYTQLLVVVTMLSFDFLINHLFRISYNSQNIFKILVFNVYWALLASIPFFIFIVADYYRVKGFEKIDLVIQQTVHFKGRMNRANYTFCTLLLIFTGFAIRNLHSRLSLRTGLLNMPERVPDIVVWGIFVVLMLSMTVLLFNISIKRLRDLDVEGFGSLIFLLIPGINLIYIIYLMVRKGKNIETYYGQPDQQFIIK